MLDGIVYKAARPFDIEAKLLHIFDDQYSWAVFAPIRIKLSEKRKALVA